MGARFFEGVAVVLCLTVLAGCKQGSALANETLPTIAPVPTTTTTVPALWVARYGDVVRQQLAVLNLFVSEATKKATAKDTVGLQDVCTAFGPFFTKFLASEPAKAHGVPFEYVTLMTDYQAATMFCTAGQLDASKNALQAAAGSLRQLNVQLTR